MSLGQHEQRRRRFLDCWDRTRPSRAAGRGNAGGGSAAEKLSRSASAATFAAAALANRRKNSPLSCRIFPCSENAPRFRHNLGDSTTYRARLRLAAQFAGRKIGRVGFDQDAIGSSSSARVAQRRRLLEVGSPLNEIEGPKAISFIAVPAPGEQCSTCAKRFPLSFVLERCGRMLQSASRLKTDASLRVAPSQCARGTPALRFVRAVSAEKFSTPLRPAPPLRMLASARSVHRRRFPSSFLGVMRVRADRAMTFGNFLVSARSPRALTRVEMVTIARSRPRPL